jgi:succinate dehydrogenase / fumarate reductase cytochrome b subunit
MMYAFEMSLKSEAHFSDVKSLLENQIIAKIITHGFLASLSFHLLAGIRHLAMDLGYAEELKSAHLSALVVFTGSLILTVLLGIWIW